MKAWILKSHQQHGVIKADGSHDVPKADMDSGSAADSEPDSSVDSSSEDGMTLNEMAMNPEKTKRKNPKRKKASSVRKPEKACRPKRHTAKRKSDIAKKVKK